MLTVKQLDILAKRRFHQTKGAGPRVIHKKLEKYSGNSLRKISCTLSNIPAHQQLHLKFSNKAPIRPITSSRVMERLQIDLVNKQSDKVKYNGKVCVYILSVIDIFSRYTWLYAMEKKSSKLVAQHLKSLFRQYGQPDIVQHDQGSEFRGSVGELLSKMSIKCIVSSPYHPQSQGKIERMHGTLKKIMRYDIVHKRSVNWAEQLGEYQKVINERPRPVLGMQTPFEVFFGRKRKGKSSRSADLIHQLAGECTRNINAKLVAQQEKTLNTPTYEIDDTVLVKLPSKISRVTTKLRYATGKVINRNINLYKYKVQWKDGSELKKGWFHVKDMLGKTKTMQKEREKKNMSTKNLLQPLTTIDRIENLQRAHQISVVYNPPGDGNCMFHAIANQIGNGSNHKDIRGRIINYLVANTHLGEQSDISWHDLLLNETPLEYLNRMSNDGTYGDQITLQAAAEIFNIQIVIISSLNEGTTLIRPDGGQEFDQSEPFVVLGHLAEGDGEHYLSMDQRLSELLPIIIQSRQINLKTNDSVPMTSSTKPEVISTSESQSQIDVYEKKPLLTINQDDSGEPQLSHASSTTSAIYRLRSMVTPGKVQTQTTIAQHRSNIRLQVTFDDLPNEIKVIIFAEALKNQLVQYCLMQRDPVFAKFLVGSVRKPIERIYLNNHVDVKLNCGTLPYITVSVRRISKLAGQGSGLMLSIRNILQGNAHWFNAWFVLVAGKRGWYVINDIFWK